MFAKRTCNDSDISQNDLSYETIRFRKYWMVLKLYVKLYKKKTAKHGHDEKISNPETVWVFLYKKKRHDIVIKRSKISGLSRAGPGRFITDMV